VSETVTEVASDAGQMGRAGTEPGARLLINVYQIALAGDPATNPPLRLMIRLEGNLLRPGDGSNAGRLFLRYESRPRKYMEWAGDHARVLREEWNQAATYLAEKTVAWLTGTVPPPQF
jgi:hypothetical protein